jgi:hypothetical protein
LDFPPLLAMVADFRAKIELPGWMVIPSKIWTGIGV